jgi:imidazolonepropionase-like amidohydrolase
LIDNHVHVLGAFVRDITLSTLPGVFRQIKKNLRACIASGVTTIRDMGGIPRQIQAFRKKVERHQIPGPRIVCCNSMITCPGGYPEFIPHLAGLKRLMLGGQVVERVKTPEETRATVRHMVKLGADWIKTTHSSESALIGRATLPCLSSECYKALVDEAHRLGRPVAIHHDSIYGFSKAVEIGSDSLEHVSGNGMLSEDDIKMFVDKGLAIIPTLKGLGDYLILKDIAKWLENTREDYLEEIAVVGLSGLLGHYTENRDDGKTYLKGICVDIKRFQSMYPQALANVHRIREAGGTIGVGTDSGGTEFGLFGMVWLELEHLVRAGMSELEALQAATKTNAKILGKQSSLGTIEAGKYADLVILGANPLDNIRHIQDVRMVWKDGRLVFRRSPADGQSTVAT